MNKNKIIAGILASLGIACFILHQAIIVHLYTVAQAKVSADKPNRVLLGKSTVYLDDQAKSLYTIGRQVSIGGIICMFGCGYILVFKILKPNPKQGRS